MELRRTWGVIYHEASSITATFSRRVPYRRRKYNTVGAESFFGHIFVTSARSVIIWSHARRPGLAIGMSKISERFSSDPVCTHSLRQCCSRQRHYEDRSWSVFDREMVESSRPTIVESEMGQTCWALCFDTGNEVVCLRWESMSVHIPSTSDGKLKMSAVCG